MGFEPTSGLNIEGLRRLRDTKAPIVPEREESVSGFSRSGLLRTAGLGPETMAAPLTTQQRKNMDKSDFVFPDRAPGPGSYPIGDRKHGGLAIGFSKGTKDEATVRRVVCKRYPDLPACQ
jgi:hypothetical protein